MVAQGTREASPCAFFVYPFRLFALAFWAIECGSTDN